MSHSKTWGEIIPKKTTGQLKEMLNEVNESIDIVECFGVQDLVIRELCERELHKRGKQ